MSVFRGIIGSLTINLDANVAQFESDMGRAERSARREIAQINRQINSIQQSSNAAAAQVGKLTAQIVALGAAGLAAASQQFKALADDADRIAKLAQQTGLTAEAVQELGFAAEQSGGDVESLTTSVIRMQRNIQQAEDGLATYTRAFERVGISIEQLRGLAPDEQFTLLAQALSEIDDEVVRNASAMDIFGRSVQNLIPLILEGEAGIEDLRQQLRDTGSVLSQDTVEDAERFNDAIGLLIRQLTAFRNAIFADIIEPLANLVDYWARTEEGAQQLQSYIDAVKTSFVALGVFLAGRFVVQMGLAINSFIQAEIRIAALVAKNAQLAGSANVAAVSYSTLGRAIGLMFGPVGIAITAVSVIASMGLAFRNAAADANDLETRIDALTQSTEGLALSRFTDTLTEISLQMLDAAQQVETLQGRLEALQNIRSNPTQLAFFQGNDGPGAIDIDQQILAIEAAIEKAETAYAGLEEQQSRVITAYEEEKNRLEALRAAQAGATDGTLEMADNYDELRVALEAEIAALEGGAAAWEEYQKQVFIANQVAKLGKNASAQQIASITALANKLFGARKAFEAVKKSGDDAFDAIGELARIEEIIDPGLTAVRELERQLDVLDRVAAELQLPDELVDQLKTGLKEAFAEATTEAEDMERAFMNAARALEYLGASISPAVAGYQQFGQEVQVVNDAIAQGLLTQAEGEFTKMALAAEYTLGSLSQLAGQGSREQQALALAAQAANTVLAIQAILNQGQGDPYTAPFRMAAMAAAVAPLVHSAINFAHGSGGSDPTEQRQRTQGTGTILGDSEAKSESIANAVEITADATSELVGINRGMLRALQELQGGISGAAGFLARGAAEFEVDLSGMGTNDFGRFTQLLIDPLGGPLADFLGGSADLVDEGIRIIGGSFADLMTGAMVEAFQSVEEKKHLFDDKDLEQYFQALDDDVQAQFNLIFQSIAQTVEEAAIALGLDAERIREMIENFRIDEILVSLEGLTGEEQAAELAAVFSGIFDDLVLSVIPFIAQFQQVGEGLGETLIRVATSIQVFEEAVYQLGLAFNITDPERVAQIAVGLVEMVGGIEEFISGFTRFVDLFATDEHKLAVATDVITRAFEEAGLVLPDTRDEIWGLMQALDATTEAGQRQIATLLELGPVLDEYYDLIEESERARLAAAEEAAQLARDQLALVRDFIGGAPQGLVDLQQRFVEAMKAAEALGASTKEYALIARSFDRQLRRMQLEMTQTVIQLAQNLFSEDSDALASTFESEFEGVRRVANSLFSEWERALKDLVGFADSVLLDENLTTLSPREQLNEAERQFRDLLRRANAGDVEAAGELSSAAQAYLQEARFMFASGGQYQRIFNEVQQALRGVQMPPGIPEYTMEIAENTARTATAVEKMQNELLAGIEKLLAAQDLANALRDLSYVMDESVIGLAQSLGIPIDQLVTALGVDLEDINHETIVALFGVAELLGANLDDLGDALGLDIEALARQFGVDLNALDFESQFTEEIDYLASINDHLATIAAYYGRDVYSGTPAEKLPDDHRNPVIRDPRLDGLPSDPGTLSVSEGDSVRFTLVEMQEENSRNATRQLQALEQLNQTLTYTAEAMRAVR